MVDVAKEVKNEETSIPTQQEISETAASAAAEKAHTEAEEENISLRDEKSLLNDQNLCNLPTYTRNYTAACPDGFTQPSWANGHCYCSGLPRGHGPNLVDFRSLSVEDKKNWEAQTCLLFPRVTSISESTRTVIPKDLSGIDKEKLSRSVSHNKRHKIGAESETTNAPNFNIQNKVLEELAKLKGPVNSETESSSGAVRATGQFIPSSSFGGGFSQSYGSRESREQSLQRGYMNVQRIADRLRLPMSLIESAQRIYLMAMQRGYTLGRINTHVAAACLYISCRRDKSPYMLIDFSDVLLSPVRTLGRIFVKLLRVLHIHVPTIDPSLFMERFASQMELGNKTHSVTQTGVRLVQAMARDWICTGRRPTGLCGAALLIAARFHGFKINSSDISSIIRMSAATVNKRLSEFKHTCTAQIKASEFETTDLLTLPILHGPPSLEASRTTEALKAITFSSSGELQLSANVANEKEIPAIMEKPDSGKKYRPMVEFDATEDEICQSAPSSSDISSLANRLISAIEKQVTGEPVPSCHISLFEDEDIIAPESNKQGVVLNGKDENDIEDATDWDNPLYSLLLEVKEKASQLNVETHIEEEINDCLDSKSTLGIGHTNALIALEDSTTVCQQSIRDQLQKNYTVDSSDDIEETLSDISDTEIDALILSNEEREAKTLIWDELMKDVMPEVHRRIRSQEIKEQNLPANKRTKRHIKRLELEPAASPADSVRMAFETKNPSFAKKINNDVLESLFSLTSSPSPLDTI